MMASLRITAMVAAWSALLAGTTPLASRTPRPLRLERIVMLMRHGIRPPTRANPVPQGYSSQPWPRWPVDFGLLTDRGAAGVTLLGAADRRYYEARGLFAPGCPPPAAVMLQASGKPRAIRTAESWRDGFMPGCAVAVSHPGDADPDPVFHGLDDHPAEFDGERALRDAERATPPGGIEAKMRGYRADLMLLARVLDCQAPACPLLTEPSRLIAVPHDRPELTGPADVASTASQTFLLEYLEGMPMKEVGWGRITRAQIERLLRFHPLKFNYSNRPPYVASHAAAPLADAMLAAMTADGMRFAVFAGHDTNIADLASLLDLHWRVPSYPADDVPPGSALGFEVAADAGGTRYVRAFYRAQTMDQLREQRPLTGTDVPYRSYLPIPGCGNTTAPTGCTLVRFGALIRARAPRTSRLAVGPMLPRAAIVPSPT